jgi:glycosyltransferase involved in cell wall biosynthesis
MGALFHYAIPRAVHNLGLLGRFYTDIWSGKPWGRLLEAIPAGLRPDSLRRLLGRHAEDLPSDLVTEFPGLAFRYALERKRARNAAEELQAHINAGRRFCERIIRDGLHDCDAVYTSNSQGLELLVHARQRGLKTLSEQAIAPYAFERALLAEEQGRFPGWEESMEPAREAVEAFAARERQEWAQCDLILCGSEFVRDAIRSVGGPAERCEVVPYGFDLPNHKLESRKQKAESRKQFQLSAFSVSAFSPLRVLTVGTVCLRKGMPYIAQAAEILRGQMTFRVVGPCRLLPEGLEKLRSAVELVGAVPRSEVRAHFQWADVFLFPSLCEGSATVCYEALAAGLPVICTPNTGSVVRDGVEGFLVPIREVAPIVELLRQLDGDRRLLAAMSEAALARREFFSMEAYAVRLKQALDRNLGQKLKS